MGALRFSLGGVTFSGRVVVAFDDGRFERGSVRFEGVDRQVSAEELAAVVRATHGAEGTRVRTKSGTAVLDIGRVLYDAGAGRITGFEEVRLLRWEPPETAAVRSTRSTRRT